MYTLLVDVAMTRRKLFHFVVDEDESLLWSGQRVGDALDWLHDQGHSRTILDTGERKFEVTFDPVGR